MLSPILHRQKRSKRSKGSDMVFFFLLMQRSEPPDINCPKDFDLTAANGAVTFLCEMYNLVAMLEELAKHLDRRKQDSLVKINQDPSKMVSLTSEAKQDRTGGSTLASIGEVDSDEEPQDDLGVFGADDIQAILKRMNYKINRIPAGVRVLTTSGNVILTLYKFLAVSTDCLRVERY
jgi:hypothetical protein